MIVIVSIIVFIYVCYYNTYLCVQGFVVAWLSCRCCLCVYFPFLEVLWSFGGAVCLDVYVSASVSVFVFVFVFMFVPVSGCCA